VRRSGRAPFTAIGGARWPPAAARAGVRKYHCTGVVAAGPCKCCPTAPKVRADAATLVALKTTSREDTIEAPKLVEEAKQEIQWTAEVMQGATAEEQKEFALLRPELEGTPHGDVETLRRKVNRCSTYGSVFWLERHIIGLATATTCSNAKPKCRIRNKRSSGFLMRTARLTAETWRHSQQGQTRR